ncbi:FadR family transcriptional regulator [Spiractinospora alimapuensis]|uniref:FadR/GntR family transcriptional regulator n=1 Tax=Spiractinospora alimapuensis TaxID=2820884 RepID=UPI001F3F8845|nr:FadR/GntR family transcriptional regulator [Spiractinospora alimapuensis]QVQ53484.1 FadR family transcriptional regulator [Spiractinospora alimapuensis]
MTADRSSTETGSEGLLKLQPYPRASAVSEIVSQLVSRILAGDIPPGGKLPPERRLAENLGVGRSAIREALKALDLLGLIEIRQGDGTYLSQGTSSLLPQVVEWGMLLGTPQTLDLIETRSHLEVILARLAAERITDDEASALRTCLTRMGFAESAADFARADTEFHLTIAAAARNQVLSDILSSIKSLLHVWVLRVIRQTGERESVIEQHQAILDAVVSRSPDGAAAAMDQHMRTVTARLRQSIDEEGGAPSSST